MKKLSILLAFLLCFGLSCFAEKPADDIIFSANDDLQEIFYDFEEGTAIPADLEKGPGGTYEIVKNIAGNNGNIFRMSRTTSNTGNMTLSQNYTNPFKGEILIEYKVRAKINGEGTGSAAEFMFRNTSSGGTNVASVKIHDVDNPDNGIIERGLTENHSSSSWVRLAPKGYPTEQWYYYRFIVNMDTNLAQVRTTGVDEVASKETPVLAMLGSSPPPAQIQRMIFQCNSVSDSDIYIDDLLITNDLSAGVRYVTSTDGKIIPNNSKIPFGTRKVVLAFKNKVESESLTKDSIAVTLNGSIVNYTGEYDKLMNKYSITLPDGIGENEELNIKIAGIRTEFGKYQNEVENHTFTGDLNVFAITDFNITAAGAPVTNVAGMGSETAARANVSLRNKTGTDKKINIVCATYKDGYLADYSVVEKTAADGTATYTADFTGLPAAKTGYTFKFFTIIGDVKTLSIKAPFINLN